MTTPSFFSRFFVFIKRGQSVYWFYVDLLIGRSVGGGGLGDDGLLVGVGLALVRRCCSPFGTIEDGRLSPVPSFRRLMATHGHPGKHKYVDVFVDRPVSGDLVTRRIYLRECSVTTNEQTATILCRCRAEFTQLHYN